MRKFYLENKYGMRFDFTYHNETLLTDVSGLGFSNTFTYLKYENFYDTLGSNFQVSEISGIVTFLNGYQGYKKFLEYLAKGQENLKLHYESSESLYSYVDIVSLSKSEIKAGGLQSEIIFTKKSYWIKDRVFEISTSADTHGKRYLYNYPYKYSDASLGSLVTVVGGHLKASLVIEMLGSVDNPSLQIKQNQTIISEVRLIHKRENAKIKVSGILNELYMIEEVNGKWFDIYQTQDFEKDNFIRLEPGSLTFEFHPGVSGLTRCKLFIQEYYLG